MNYSQLNDQSLVLLTLTGDQSAYEVLVRKYQRSVLAAAGAVTHNPYMAEDAAQDAFVTAWIKLNTLSEPSKFRSWVCRIAANCARRMLERYRSFISLDEIGEIVPASDIESDPVAYYNKQEEASELYRHIGKLPDRVRDIIRMYYIEGRTINDIAEYLGVTVGTVKSQLHDGRQKLRKDLGAMNENLNDTLTERVMKKVEELKKWQYKNEKTGFEVIYKEVLSDVEALPESQLKNHALADVLLRGYWWVEGQENDTLLKRIKQAAIDGKNETVMSVVIDRESYKLWGDGRIHWLKNVAIPELERYGFKSAAGHAWLSVARSMNFRKSDEELPEVLDKVEKLSPKDSCDHRIVRRIRELYSKAEKYKNTEPNRFGVTALADELHIDNGKPRYWDGTVFSCGEIECNDWGTINIYENAAYDGHFTLSELNVGENYNEKLYFVADNETVETPAGTFTGCQMWVVNLTFTQIATYYKRGIGIVRQDYIRDGCPTVHVLSEYKAKGDGLIPLEVGNKWAYVLSSNDSSLKSEYEFSVDANQNGKVIITGLSNEALIEYNTDKWEDMVSAIANEYFSYNDGKSIFRDVTKYIERAEVLAKTPMQKAHTKAASSVALRIMGESPELTPDHQANTCWEFFDRRILCRNGGKVMTSDYNSRWSFELKDTDNSIPCQILLNNFIYNIMAGNGNAFWNDDWKDGYCDTLKFPERNDLITSEISVLSCGEYTVPAGTFADCLKIRMNVRGYGEGHDYRNGMHEYIFAKSVGLISATSEVGYGTAKAVYLLTEYEGIGDGYMPLEDGLFRRYEAQNVTDGYVGWTEYTFIKADESANFDGCPRFVLFSNQAGYRKKQSAITEYSCIAGEADEKKLFDENKIGEGQFRSRINDLKILLHMAFRDHWLVGCGNMAASHQEMMLNVLKALDNGKIPEAFIGYLARRSLSLAAAYMGDEKFDKGFEKLDECFDAYRKWEAIPEGTLLSVGNDLMYKDVKMVKGKPILVLPDGSREFAGGDLDGWKITGSGKDHPYQAMTAPHGWEWFDPVRNHPVYGEKFKEYVEKARILAEE